MKYNFDEIIDRRNTNSMKWDVADGELPMWVADMDFQTAPAIRAAMEKRLAHGIFGYTDVPDAWYQAYIHWWKDRHDFVIEKDWLIFSTGVIPSISSIVRKLTTPAENVVIQTPVYNIFFNSIVNNGRNVLQSPLAYDGSVYKIDFADLEEKLKNSQTSLMILCNPHNPIGKIWDKETLCRIGDLCAKYNVTVISDEVHCDLTAPNRGYIPFAAASETNADISITCIAPTKAFNIAGMQTSAVVIPNPNLRHKVWRGLNTDEVAEPNAFAIDVTVAAFEESGDWLDSLRTYIQTNKETAIAFIERELPQLHVIPTEATYLLWIDCSKVSHDTKTLAADIRKKTGLYLSEGSQYGGNGGNFLRLNLACPFSVVEDGLQRLKKGILS